jgi:outer membrane immunogenic protein
MSGIGNAEDLGRHLGAIMKKLLLGTLALAALTGAVPAIAAELPVRPAAAPAYSNWNGWYVGINAGGGFQSQEASLTNTGSTTGVVTSFLAAMFGPTVSAIGVPMWVSGPLGGFTVGWNWQAGWWLAGIEADIDCANITGISNLTTPGLTIGVTNTLNRFGTVRGRLGVLAGPTSNFLLYGTGGFAYGRNTLELTALAPFAGPPANLYNQDRATKTGWTAGGGIEWMFLPSWTVKGEYLYTDLGSQTTSVTYFADSAVPGTLTVSNNDRFHIVRFGLNYIFGGLGGLGGGVGAY